ncbi:MAG TPA: MobV family relaxase [Hymenobacter sp.]|nr:MobV family relaxase [Hymenobacter sp.]
MPYAVLRVAKIKTQAHALAATAHNYRQKAVPNAELDEARPNREYLNREEKDYWSLAEARIQEAGVKRVRSDSVRAMEVILTGSPEGFVRDKEGRAADYSKSKWAQDNLNFLQKQFGKENVVSFTLHQDEKTPHIHAVVVPITEKKTLSADQLFNPQSLRRLQTEYAAAMSEHGMSRGVEHSQAHHQPMRRLYGQEVQVSKRVAELSQTPAPEAFELRDPPLLGREAWKHEEEARINAEIARQVGQAQERAQKLAELAQGNTAAAERVKTLQKQLHTAEGLKQGHFGELQTLRQESTTTAQALDSMAVAYVQGGNLGKFREYGELVREQTRQALVAVAEQTLRQPVHSEQTFRDKLQAAGYQVKRTPEGKAELVHQETGARFPSKEILPNGRPLGEQLKEAIERTAKQVQQQQKSQGRGLGL